MLRQRPTRPDRTGPPHGPGEWLVLAAWLLVLAGGAITVAWLLISALS